MNASDLAAGPELDALVAEKVMGWRGVTLHPSATTGIPPAEDGSRGEAIPKYSTDIAAAWEVALVLKQRFRRIELSGDMEDGGAPFFWFEIGGESEDPDFQYIASTAELAICKAALLATEKIQ